MCHLFVVEGSGLFWNMKLVASVGSEYCDPHVTELEDESKF
jgi:hypothetical protein